MTEAACSNMDTGQFVEVLGRRRRQGAAAASGSTPAENPPPKKQAVASEPTAAHTADRRSAVSMCFDDDIYKPTLLVLSNDLKRFLPDLKLRQLRYERGAWFAYPMTNVDVGLLLNLLRSPPDAAFNGSPIKIGAPIAKPRTHPTFTVVVKGVQTNISDDDIATALKDAEYTSVTDIVRFRHKSDQAPMPVVRIDLAGRAEFNILLNRGLYVGYGHYKCEPRNERPKPLQCFKCQAYNHVAKACTAPAAKCRFCGGDAHPKGDRCTDPKKCANCGGDHTSTYRGCQANREATKQSHSYADILTGRVAKSTEIATALSAVKADLNTAVTAVKADVHTAVTALQEDVERTKADIIAKADSVVNPEKVIPQLSKQLDRQISEIGKKIEAHVNAQIEKSVHELNAKISKVEDFFKRILRKAAEYIDQHYATPTTCFKMISSVFTLQGIMIV